MAKCNGPTPEEIAAAFAGAEEQFGDKSTEFLASIVADQLGIDYGNVFIGLGDAGEGATK
ncbi:hypothetical protein [Ancylobacter amanitiformis]|uniref:Uncharacterized protein n=1 Tax=Ancylobacter amanitiformis TaxID=217069 RepID=A0ABU0LQG2_9HYPH|nr:hypothetical protein [Ancylobacter amanitiformis]MDQ0510950.1 hypothetical protein [Ancylobacter amanitiformis]